MICNHSCMTVAACLHIATITSDEKFSCGLLTLNSIQTFQIKRACHASMNVVREFLAINIATTNHCLPRPAYSQMIFFSTQNHPSRYIYIAICTVVTFAQYRYMLNFLRAECLIDMEFNWTALCE